MNVYFHTVLYGERLPVLAFRPFAGRNAGEISR